MRIRAIELVGFKSFRDSTRLALAEGLNAIVGPNGCGKSNVADAIRWALGEQSARHLRAREMEDVIFGGNAASPPLNFAEVTLTFERNGSAEADRLWGEQEEGREDDSLLARLARQAEFTVTRRLFRTGESQYLINEQPVRLRDVTELFLGSGVGPKAYAIIEQGRVSQLVAAKPEEVRLFIEEAAGTTRFRSRKLAAERKLARTAENLTRVRDVMREIELQLRSLRRQAQRAEEYRALSAERREVELRIAAAEWAALRAEVAALDSERAGLRERMARLRDALEAGERRRDAAGEEARRAAGEIERAIAALGEVGARLVRAAERREAARLRERSLGERGAALEEERTRLGGRVGELRRAAEAAAAERARATERVEACVRELEAAEAEWEHIAPELERRRRERVGAAARLDDARSRAASAADRRAETASRLAGLREERRRVAERLAACEAAREAASRRLREAEAEHERAASQREALTDSRRRAAAALEAEEEAARELAEEQAAVRDAALHVRGRLDGLAERERAFDGYAEGVAEVMAAGGAPVRSLLVEALEIPAELEPAVAAVLGEALKGVVVSAAEEAVAIVERLRADSKGRLSLVPQDGAGGGSITASGWPAGTVPLAASVAPRPGFEALRDALLGDVGLAADLTTALAAWRASPRRTWVTRAGDLVDRRGVVTGGERPAATSLLERRRLLGELREALASHERREAELGRRLDELHRSCAALGSELRRLDGEAHEATLDFVAAEHGLAGARQAEAGTRARAEEARGELAATDELVATADAAAREAEGACRRAEEAVEREEGKAEEAEASFAACRERVERSRERRDRCREAVAAARQDLTAAVAEHGRLEHEEGLLVSRLDALGDELDRVERERRAALEEDRALGAEIEGLRGEHAERERAVELARAAAREVEARAREVEAEVARLRGDGDALRDRLGGLEVAIAERRTRLDGLAATARERHGVEVAELPAPGEVDLERERARAAGLRRRIERLGDVNVTAIADARELEERYGFLTAQRDDLEASMEDLRQTIAELSRTTRQRFLATFEAANRRFGEVFAELFRGGRAALKLSRPTDVLESGVEIEVQPPGKRVGNLALLSGGERALTAVSLLMALFSLRATPFCVLDEVDAPLDEANVGRFNAMLRRMAARTQFIVVTHNQRTMESSDALYGVTMREPGVSQLVSVRLAGREPVGLAASA